LRGRTSQGELKKIFDLLPVLWGHRK
jgi:hypothetical protein